MTFKRLILGALGATLFASAGYANNGVLFNKADDPTYETPTEVLWRAKRIVPPRFDEGRGVAAGFASPGASANSVEERMSDRLARETRDSR